MLCPDGSNYQDATDHFVLDFLLFWRTSVLACSVNICDHSFAVVDVSNGDCLSRQRSEIDHASDRASSHDLEVK